MISLAPIILLGWIPVALVLVLLIPSRRAVVAVAISGWLFMPPISISLAGFPDYSKTTAISLSVLLGTVIFDFNRLLSFRLRWFELGEAPRGSFDETVFRHRVVSRDRSRN